MVKNYPPNQQNNKIFLLFGLSSSRLLFGYFHMICVDKANYIVDDINYIVIVVSIEPKWLQDPQA